MNILSIFSIVVAVAENVPAAIGVFNTAIANYNAATDVKGKLGAVVAGIEALAEEIKTVVSSL